MAARSRWLTKWAAATRAAWDDLSLAAKFAGIAAIVTAISMAALGAWVSHRVTTSVIHHSTANTAHYLGGLVEPLVTELETSPTLSAATIERIDAIFENVIHGRKVIGVKIWASGGRLAYSTDRARMGKVFPVSQTQARAWDGEVAAEYNELHELESEYERSFGMPLTEVYIPVHSAASGNVYAVVEIYEIADRLAAELRSLSLQSIGAVGLLMTVIMASLFRVVGQGSRTIQEQKAVLAQRVNDLARMLDINRALKQRVENANRRALHSYEAFLRRIGAELHDGPAQLIGLSLLRLDSLEPKLPPPSHGSGPHAPVRPDAPDDLEIIRTSLTDCLTEIRAIYKGLVLPDLVGVTAADAIRMAARNHEYRTGSRVALGLGEDVEIKLNPTLTTCVYRFAQEGLNNSFRHAGGLGQRVSASVVDGKLRLELLDDGPGFGGRSSGGQSARTATDELSPGGGLGLRGLQDRFVSIGGSFSVDSRPGKGVTLTAELDISNGGTIHA